MFAPPFSANRISSKLQNILFNSLCFLDEKLDLIVYF